MRVFHRVVGVLAQIGAGFVNQFQQAWFWAAPVAERLNRHPIFIQATLNAQDFA
jgi:hypothetical protein